jgi:hypothetical protein
VIDQEEVDVEHQTSDPFRACIHTSCVERRRESIQAMPEILNFVVPRKGKHFLFTKFVSVV